MLAIDSSTERRTVGPRNKETKERSAKRSRALFSLSEPQSHPISHRFLIRLFWD